MNKYSNIKLAKGFANRADKMMMIILGDDSKYWGVSMAQGEALIKKGYQVAK